MRVLTSIAFGSLFAAGAIGFILSTLQLVSSEPWNLDSAATLRFLTGTVENEPHHTAVASEGALDVPSFLASLSPETPAQRVHLMLRLLCHLCALSVLLASATILLVCLLATHNSACVLVTQSLLVVWLSLVRLYGAPILQDAGSLHSKTLMTLLCSNVVGLLSYVTHLFFKTAPSTPKHTKKS